jgi:prevent-host-death family protein
LTKLTKSKESGRLSSMAKQVNLYEAKTRLSHLVERAAAGEEIIIAKDGKPRARLVSLKSERPSRRAGAGRGKVWLADDFDAPLPADLLAVFGVEERHGGCSSIPMCSYGGGRESAS